MDALHLFLHDHARVHSASVTEATEDSAADRVLAGLTTVQIRLCPRQNLNTLAWLWWHMARYEDVAFNLLLTDGRQVLDQEAWLPRLRVRRRDIGTEMTAAEVVDLSDRLDIRAVRAYRDAVGRRTRQVVGQLCPEDLCTVVPEARLRRAFSDGVLIEGRADRVKAQWTGKTVAWFLWMGTCHNAWHLGEATCIRSQLPAWT